MCCLADTRQRTAYGAVVVERLHPLLHRLRMSLSSVRLWSSGCSVRNLADLKPLQRLPALAGRVMTKRTSSAKLLFYDISGEGAKVQIMADLGCGPWARPSSGCRDGKHGYTQLDRVGKRGIDPRSCVWQAECLHSCRRTRLLPSQAMSVHSVCRGCAVWAARGM